MLEVLALYPGRSEVKFNTRFESGPLIIKGDPVSIRQVVHNLLINALEAIENKGQIDIYLSKVQKNYSDYIEMSCYDNGPGINEEHLEKIFEPYVTTKAKGTGLGLAIVKKIIEEHGGAIWVDTRYKAGAGFIIQLPAVESENRRS